MTNEEWIRCDSASEMLAHLNETQPDFLKSQIRNLHRFLIACSWKHKNLIPQAGLRNGLVGAEKWLAGEIDDDALSRLDWHAEAVAFGLDYAKTPEDIAEIQTLIDGITEVRDLPFEQAHARLRDAAYFAEGAIIYPTIDRLPWVERLFTSEFLCPHLLREHLRPDLT